MNEKNIIIEQGSIELKDNKEIIWEMQETKTGLATTGMRQYIFIIDKNVDGEDITIRTILYDIADISFAREIFESLHYIVSNLTA